MLTLVFAGPLSAYIGRASIFLVVGAFVTSTIVAFGSSWKGSIAIIQDVPVVILTLVAGRIVTRLGNDLSLDIIFITVIVTIMLATVGTGLFMYGLGRLQIGNLVRFFPYPVLAGFLGGTGWLLLVGGATTALASGNSAQLLQLESLIFWLPAALLALTIYFVNRRIDHPLMIPVVILSGVGLFYMIVFSQGYSLLELTEAGWLVGALPAGMAFNFPDLNQFANVAWGTILFEAGSLFVLMVASTIAMMLNNTGFELVVDSDFDVNRDLRIHGLANIIGGILGGWPHYVTPGWSALNATDKKEHPFTGLLIPIFAGVMLFFTTQYFAYLPRFALATMVVYLGIIFLVEWVIQPAKQLPLLEYGITLLIVLVIAFLGLLQGVGVGLVLAIILFAINYSQINALSSIMTGEHEQSRVTRVPEQRAFIKSNGDKTYIMHLQGYLFFGSVTHLLEQVKEITATQKLNYMVIDFERVVGFDSTALLSFSKMLQFLEREEVALLFSGLSPEQLDKVRGFTQLNEAQSLQIFESADAALQSIEDVQLLEAGYDLTAPQPSIEDQIQMLVPESTNVNRLFELLECLELDAGEVLIEAGAQADDMFFIKEGSVTAQLEREDGRIIRLETMGTGRAVGELGFYLNQERTASVVSSGPSVVYRLSKENLTQIEQQHPEIASTIHRVIVKLLADRVTHLVKVVDVLQK